MTSIIVLNVMMVLLGAVAASPLVPVSVLSEVVSFLHTNIGITTPPPEKARVVVLFWIGATIVLVDGLFFLLVYLMLTIK